MKMCSAAHFHSSLALHIFIHHCTFCASLHVRTCSDDSYCFVALSAFVMQSEKMLLIFHLK